MMSLVPARVGSPFEGLVRQGTRRLVLRCLFSAPKGHRKIASGFQPLDPECERGPGAGSSPGY